MLSWKHARNSSCLHLLLLLCCYSVGAQDSTAGPVLSAPAPVPELTIAEMLNKQRKELLATQGREGAADQLDRQASAEPQDSPAVVAQREEPAAPTRHPQEPVMAQASLLTPPARHQGSDPKTSFDSDSWNHFQRAYIAASQDRALFNPSYAAVRSGSSIAVVLEQLHGAPVSGDELMACYAVFKRVSDAWDRSPSPIPVADFLRLVGKDLESQHLLVNLVDPRFFTVDGVSLAPPRAEQMFNGHQGTNLHADTGLFGDQKHSPPESLSEPSSLRQLVKELIIRETDELRTRVLSLEQEVEVLREYIAR